MVNKAGYREGITAGKESALQEGFDQGFAQVGAALGRKIGLLRGVVAALTSFLSNPKFAVDSGSSSSSITVQDDTTREQLLHEAREISSALNEIRFSDIAPPDLEAQKHAREHLLSSREHQNTNDDHLTKMDLDMDLEIDLGDEIAHKRDIEKLEDLFTQMDPGSVSSGGKSKKKERPTLEDVGVLEDRLRILTGALGLPLPQFT